MIVHFEVPGEPAAKGAVKHAMISGHVHGFTDARTRSALAVVRFAAAQAMEGRSPMDGPLLLVIRSYRAKGMPKSKRRRELAEREAVKPITRPDYDNYAKLVGDACTGVVWCDDAQVTDTVQQKRYSSRPRIEVWVVDQDSPEVTVSAYGLPLPAASRQHGGAR